MLRDSLGRVANEFTHARGRDFAGDELAAFIRRDMVEAARAAVGTEFDDFLVRASPGQGVWAAVPWLAFFDPLITRSAQGGYYVVYLFDAQMEKLYLSLNQGTTALEREFGNKVARAVLRERAEFMRIRLSDRASPFSSASIDLSSPANLPIGYEAGHAFGMTYDLSNLPTEEHLVSNLSELLRVYRTLTERGGLTPSESLFEEAGTNQIVEARKYVLSRRIERKHGVREAVLKVHRQICEGCEFDPFRHLDRGKVPSKNVPLDVHHLFPISSIEEGAKLTYDVPNDFAVLCPTCHRIIHTFDDPSDIERLRSLIRFKHAELVS